MRITEVETVSFALPFKQPYVTARGSLERREMILLRLRTDSGIEGLGEAVPLGLRGGAPLAKVERRLRRAAFRVARSEISDFEGGNPLAAAVDAFVHVAAGRRLPEPAAAALEMALFDLAGKAAGEPLWKLLGAEQAETVPCNATLTAGSPAEVAAQSERWAGLGFDTFKLKLGAGDDLEQVAAVREALGPEAKIRIDANASWSAEDATRILERLEPLALELAEQPVATLRDLARIREATSIPIAADESVTGAKDAAKAARSGACDLATAKLAKVGGIGAAAGVVAELPTYLSSALDGPLGIAAAAHAAQALYRDRADPGIAHGLATQLLFAETTAAHGCEVADGLLSLPGGPGLGVVLDEQALERHRL